MGGRTRIQYLTRKWGTIISSTTLVSLTAQKTVIFLQKEKMNDTHAHTRAHIHTHTYTDTYRDTHTHKYTETHIHKHIHRGIGHEGP